MSTKVSNLINSRGNTIANQFCITTNKGRFFQSYKSMIVFIPFDGGKTQLGEDWNYSKTTSTHRNSFLGETSKETQSKLDAGIYILNLNL